MEQFSPFHLDGAVAYDEGVLYGPDQFSLRSTSVSIRYTIFDSIMPFKFVCTTDTSFGRINFSFLCPSLNKIGNNCYIRYLAHHYEFCIHFTIGIGRQWQGDGLLNID